MELTSTFALRAAADNPRVACQPKLTSFGNDKRRLAERVGFEPTCPLRDKTLSRRPRYDHFGTSPSGVMRAKRTVDYSARSAGLDLNRPLSDVIRSGVDDAQPTARGVYEERQCWA